MTHEQMTNVLVQQSLLTEEQQALVLDSSATPSDNQCFLEHTAEQFGLHEIDLLDALTKHMRHTAAEVKLTQTAHDPQALEYLAARDAWDYLVLPLAVEPDGHLLCCTTTETLSTALAFLMRTLAVPFRIVLTDVRPLEQYIAEQYHYEGVDVDLDIEAA
ncbi:MAG: hypothetical protein AAGJ38_11380 [Planctomycetota bacterium]